MKVIIAAGGTGGHLFPGIALADEFITRNKATELLFIGTKREMEKYIFAQKSFAFEAIETSSLKGKTLLNATSALFSVSKGIFQSIMIIKEFKPDIVIGLGGYFSGPVVLAAFLMRVKTAIHEQNALPGLTNKILAKIATQIFVSFEETLCCFPHKKTLKVGNPIRKQCVKPESGASPTGPFTLLILGGSLGSHQINRAMIDALEDLLPLKDKIRIVHQTGKDDFTLVKEHYQRTGFSAEVLPFIDEIAQAYQQAHLVISRAGATTLAELMARHKASILIPYPLAADHHQHLNAQALVRENAAQMIDPDQLTGSRLARHIHHYYHHPEQRLEVEQNAGKMGRPEAAQEMVEYCYKLIHTGTACINA